MASESQDIKTSLPANTPSSPQPTVTVTETKPKTATKKRLSVPPPGFKFVKVRAKDGSIVTVKRKLTEEELATQKAAESVKDKVEAEKIVEKSETVVDSKDPEKIAVKTATETTREVVPEATADTTSVSATDLDEQKVRFREGRTRRIKDALTRGFFTVAGSAVPAVGIDVFREDDEIVDHEDDPSDLEDELDDHDDDTSNSHSDDLEKGHSSGAHVQLNAGQMLGNMAAGAAAGGAAAAAAPEKANGKSEKEKSTFTMTVKDLDKMEAQRIEKLKDRPLQRHWATVTFYFIAALAVVLPALFLGTSITSSVIEADMTGSGMYIPFQDEQEENRLSLEVS
jgi:hypothetical protein